MITDVVTVRKKTNWRESKSVDRAASNFFSATYCEIVGSATVPTATPNRPSGRCMIRNA